MEVGAHGAVEGDTMKYRVAALLRLLDYAKYLLKWKTKYICHLGVSGGIGTLYSLVMRTTFR